MSMPRVSTAALVAALILVTAAVLAVSAGADSTRAAAASATPATKALLGGESAGAAALLRRGARAVARERAAERARARRRAARRLAARADAVPGGPSRTTLERIAACESGGDPTAVGGGGSFRGKYQFDQGTWASVGGNGDPAAAPEAEQDYRAALLYARSGSSPWPVCGR